MTVRFDEAADADVSEAYAWHEGKQPGLGERFLEALRHAIVQIGDNPTAFQEVDGIARR